MGEEREEKRKIEDGRRETWKMGGGRKMGEDDGRWEEEREEKRKMGDGRRETWKMGEERGR